MRKHGIASLTMIAVALVASAITANTAFEGGAWAPFLALAACSAAALSAVFAISVGFDTDSERLTGYVVSFFVILILGAFVAGIVVESATDTTNSLGYETHRHIWRYASVLPWASYGAALVATVLGGIIHLIVENPES